MTQSSASAEPQLKVRVTFNDRGNQIPFWGEFTATAPQLMLWRYGSTPAFPMCDIVIVSDPTPSRWPSWLPNWPLRRRKMQIQGTSVSYRTMIALGLRFPKDEEDREAAIQHLREVIVSREGQIVVVNSVGGYHTLRKRRKPAPIRGYARVAQR